MFYLVQYFLGAINWLSVHPVWLESFRFQILGLFRGLLYCLLFLRGDVNWTVTLLSFRAIFLFACERLLATFESRLCFGHFLADGWRTSFGVGSFRSSFFDLFLLHNFDTLYFPWYTVHSANTSLSHTSQLWLRAEFRYRLLRWGVGSCGRDRSRFDRIKVWFWLCALQFRDHSHTFATFTHLRNSSSTARFTHIIFPLVFKSSGFLLSLFLGQLLGFKLALFCVILSFGLVTLKFAYVLFFVSASLLGFNLHCTTVKAEGTTPSGCWGILTRIGNLFLNLFLCYHHLRNTFSHRLNQIRELALDLLELGVIHSDCVSLHLGYEVRSRVFFLFVSSARRCCFALWSLQSWWLSCDIVLDTAGIASRWDCETSRSLFATALCRQDTAFRHIFVAYKTKLCEFFGHFINGRFLLGNHLLVEWEQSSQVDSHKNFVEFLDKFIETLDFSFFVRLFISLVLFSVFSLTFAVKLKDFIECQLFLLRKWRVLFA